MKLWCKLLCIVLCLVILTGCVSGGIQSTESSGSGDPTGTTAPADPGSDGPSQPEDPTTSPTTPGGADQPTVPGDPADPSDPTDPTDPTDPVGPSVPVDPSTPPADGIYDIGIDPLPVSEDVLYQQLFDPNNKVTLNLSMTDGELQKLQDDYERYRNMGSKSPIYRMGNLTVTIATSTETRTYRINEVGVRMKGNTSRTSFYDSVNGIYNYIHLKLDFQETFDDATYYGSSAKQWTSKDARDARKDRTFAALEQLEMRWNKCYDPTYMRESYAYELYRSEGVMAPLTNLCSFDWSNNHMGLYLLVEPVDKVFLKKRLPDVDTDGDLYKCGYVYEPANFTNANSVGIEDEDQAKFYTYDLKTNKKTSDHSALKNFIKKLNSGSLTKESLAQLVDMDSFLSYAAVSYFLGNPDDLRNNYNNFYLYFVPSTGKAIIIPYDFDRCLGLTYEWDPTGNGVTRDDPFGDRTSTNDQQRNPLLLNTVVKGGYYVKEYSEVLKKVAANPMLNIEAFESRVNQASRIYSSYVKPSKNFDNAGGRNFNFSLSDNVAGNLSVRRYFSEKMSIYNYYMGKLDYILGYERPQQVVYYIRGGFNGWQDKAEYAMTVKDGKATITLTISQNTNQNDRRFKVYNSVSQLWYNTVSEESTANYSYTGSNQNILLSPGRYTIVFDIETELITITPA